MLSQKSCLQLLLGVTLVFGVAVHNLRAQSTSKVRQNVSRNPVSPAGGAAMRYDASLRSVFGSTRTRSAPRAPSVRSVSRTLANPSGVKASDQNTQGKAFSNVARRPTVSPYLNLLRDDLFDAVGSGVPAYQTLVRPQLEQQEFMERQAVVNARQRRATSSTNQRLNESLSQLYSGAGFSPYGARNVRPTGHAAVFMNTGQFYPGRGR